MSDWGWLATVKGEAAIAGALGGLVRAIHLRSTPQYGLALIVVGTICAQYFTDFANEFIFRGVLKEGTVGFIVGTGGLSVVAFVVSFWASLRRQLKGGSDADNPRIE